MLSLLKLLHPGFMTGGTGFRSWDLGLWDIHHIFMFITMAVYTVNLILAVLAQLPIRDNIGRHLLVAVYADLSGCCTDEDQTE
jgi:hypothetical protein